jgi:hypothetical protein
MSPRAAWSELAPEQRQAAGAAVAMALSLFLPWYQATYLDREGITNSLNAFKVFTFVEAAVLLVAAGVLYLLWARANRRGFHLPGGDGWIVTAAGAWALLLLVWRLFDKPDVEGAAVGIQWGAFVAMATAGALMAAGQRVRAAHRPEPPNPAETEELWSPPRRRLSDRRDRRPVDPNALTEVLRDRPPTWEGEPPEPPGRADRRAPREEPPPLPEPRTEPKTEPLFDPPPDRLF